MKLVEINFPVPYPPPGEKELQFTRALKAGTYNHRGMAVELHYELEIDWERRIVVVTESVSGWVAYYPIESICRMSWSPDDE